MIQSTQHQTRHHKTKTMHRSASIQPLLGVLTFCFAVARISLVQAGEPVTVPPVEGLDKLASWTKGVAAADAQRKPLVIVCIGDSNTEGATYTVALRELLQGCYGERGIGYHTFGERAAMPGAPQIERQGNWINLRVGPELPPTPWFAPDLLWTTTADTQATINIAFSLGDWGRAGDRLGRIYDGQQRVRIHYQTGPGLGSFEVFAGAAEMFRVNCAAAQPGYGITEAFLADGFRIAGIQGLVTLLGFDGLRASYRHGQPTLAGGVVVQAVGRSWGQAAHFCRIEQETFDKFLGATKPDLITVLLGTNDMHNEGQPERFRTNLATLVQKLKHAAPDVGILVIACPEATQTRAGFAATYRDIASAVAMQNQCAFWPLTDLVGSRSRDWTREGLFADGLHYNRLGGSLWARLLLRQLGFDLTDLKHYPVLVSQPVTTERVTITIPNESPLVIWRQDQKAAELKLVVRGAVLQVDAKVFGANDDAGLELYIAKQGTNVVRQLALRRGGVGLHENGKDLPAPDLQPKFTPLPGGGYGLSVAVPLAVFNLDNSTKEFLLEAAALTAAYRGQPSSFNRLFASQPDGGAFRDSSQSAVVKISP